METTINCGFTLTPPSGANQPPEEQDCGFPVALEELKESPAVVDTPEDFSSSEEEEVIELPQTSPLKRKK